MAPFLSSVSCACALGGDSREVLGNLLAGNPLWFKEVEGEVPGRKVWFGAVDAPLPTISDPEYDFRANRLLLHAFRQFGDVWTGFASRHAPDRVAVVLGASNTGIDEAQGHVDEWLDAGGPPAAFRFSQVELGTPSEFLRKIAGLKGPAYTVSTACSSGAKAFAAAWRIIECGIADAAVVGGVDGKCRFALNGFNALGALSCGRCRPLADDRDGINLGEGVALFLMEKESVSCSDGFPVHVRLMGVGETSDACHATSPDPDGRGAEMAMREAMRQANASSRDVAYVNLHGTATAANDLMEMRAVARIFFGDDEVDASPAEVCRMMLEKGVTCESTKSLTGHCLGAAGAVEAAICWLLVASGRVNGVALSNSFAFGGSNSCDAMAPEIREAS